MSKIIFNGLILTDKPTGLGIYTKSILDNIDKKIINKIITQKEYDYGIDNYVINLENRGNILHVFLRNYYFKKYVKKNCSFNDLIFSPTQHGVINNNINQIITIHDLMPLFYPSGRWHQYVYYRFILPRVIRCSRKIITVSENTKKDIIKYYKVDEEKIKVIYNGCSEINEKVNRKKSTMYIEEKYNIKDYILMVGINYKYKNLHNVIKAYKQISSKVRMNLVIVGNDNVKYAKQLKRLVKELELRDKVVFLGYIDEEDKNKIYQAASLFIYPSLYEGFGLPLLEAMINEVPVLSSNSSCLTEVGGEAAIYFNPNNINDISNKIIMMNNLSEKDRVKVINRGIENALKFSWKRSAVELENVIKEYL